MAVIDFWLAKFVYPKESKQFEGKMTCTSWDLVSENKKRLTTGFSGTNDSQNLLPALISQNDLPQLENTNRELETILTRPEMLYRHFPSDKKITSKHILEQLRDSGIKVLLDCGALMLQLNNDQVAFAWLEIDPALEAVVFFNMKNVLTVKNKDGNDCPFELSPFRERLDVCGIYLDDEHTRGTDLKLPQGFRAAVTIGSGLTRDKMVQACMRMRMLGRGHFVTFWASNEVHSKIKSLSESENIGGQEVLNWVQSNSKKFEEDGMIYWTNSAVNYCKKRGAEFIFTGFSGEEETKFRQLGEQCSEAEIVSLIDTYCHARNESPFIEIFPMWFKAAKSDLTKISSPADTDHQLKTNFDAIEKLCRDRIHKIIPNKLHFSQRLDEEQERELEKEIEQESERQLPGRANPYEPTVSNALVQTLCKGQIVEDLDHFDIAEVFSCTTVKDKLQPECWGDWVFCTGDFQKTVIRESARDTTTGFLRPVNWIVKLGGNSSNTAILLAISPFEANELISHFQEGNTFKATLHQYNARILSNQSILIDNPRLTLPSSNSTHDPWDALLPPLSLCGGTLYFGTPEEEDAFANWIGIIPRPRDGYLQKRFNEDLIHPKNGFVLPANRNFERCPISISAFQSDPGSLVADICRIRNPHFPKYSHVANIILNGKKSLLPPGAEAAEC